MGMQPAMRKHR